MFKLGDRVAVNGRVSLIIFKGEVGTIIAKPSMVEYDWMILFDEKNKLFHDGSFYEIRSKIDKYFSWSVDRTERCYLVRDINLSIAEVPYDPKQQPYEDGDI